jgi:hypothetical protein
MKEHTDRQPWIIWNGSLGMVIEVTLGQVKVEDGNRTGFLAAPFDFVGPFSIDELDTHGRIAFGACLIMSRQRWREDQAELRRKTHESRRAHARHRSAGFQRTARDDKKYRDILNLPLDGALEPSAIKSAFRRLAKTAHPDVGGSNEEFHRIMEAQNALLEGVRETTR